MLLLVITSKSARFPLLHKLLQLPLLNEFFYVLLQISAIFSVMAVILVETALFLLFMYVR